MVKYNLVWLCKYINKSWFKSYSYLIYVKVDVVVDVVVDFRVMYIVNSWDRELSYF